MLAPFASIRHTFGITRELSSNAKTSTLRHRLKKGNANVHFTFPFDTRADVSETKHLRSLRLESKGVNVTLLGSFLVLMVATWIFSFHLVLYISNQKLLCQTVFVFFFVVFFYKPDSGKMKIFFSGIIKKNKGMMMGRYI